MSALELARRLDAAKAVSGEVLASDLGISRAAVWKRVEALRALGLDVVAEGGRGYRLAETVEWLDPELIRRHLALQAPGVAIPVAVAGEVESTMIEIARAAANGAPSGSVCLAEHQRAGRGRRGRAWVSPLGANLYLSMLWRFAEGLGALAGLNLAVGVAVREALATLGLARAGLKWPNDVVVDGRKIAGVLVEAGGQWNGPCHALIGVGVNWSMPQVAAAAIDQPWIDVRQVAGAPVSRNLGAAALVARLRAALVGFEQVGAEAALEQWHEHDVLRGREVVVRDAGAAWNGIAQSVDAGGRLWVLREGAGLAPVAAADVSVRVAA
jgi:BirA family biotin operon repressor/biotin-[acetyl-CoA-carboxylase] ligase